MGSPKRAHARLCGQDVIVAASDEMEDSRHEYFPARSGECSGQSVNVQDLEAVPRLTAACHVVKPAF